MVRFKSKLAKMLHFRRKSFVTMAEQARKSLISLSESMLNATSNGMDSLSFSDDMILNDSVFDGALESTRSLDLSSMDITESVSDQVGVLEEDSNAEVDEALTKAYNTSNKRFERAVGNKVINNDVIKLNPVSSLTYSRN